MHFIISSTGIFFGWLLKKCCESTGSFGWAIFTFTALTRIIIMPISIIVQKNSIKMVKMYPEINRYKAMYYGDKDMISEAQYNLYKKKRYHPLVDLIPLIIQLLLLMGVVEGIYALIDEGYPMMWLRLDLSEIPARSGAIIIPVFAAASALFMCLAQNVSNVLQSEQSIGNKLITLIVSVGLSLYLGLFVPAAIGLYWIAGNLLSIAVMYLLNILINPKKYIDYEELEESRALLKHKSVDIHEKNKKMSRGQLARERRDYRHFMSYEGKQIVFYSEGRGFYKYFKDIIENIIRRTDIVIHYVTSDYKDTVFEIETEQFIPYYIGDSKLIVLMMKMDADIVVMTTPDLQRYHIKRSMVRKDVEYIYIDHSIGSMNMTYRKHALDYFDTIFASNQFAVDEIREMEKTYGLKEKRLVKYGYCLIDNMINSYEKEKKVKTERYGNSLNILVAPSWQEDNIMDTCIEDILDSLLGLGYKITVRPHPQYIRHNKTRLMELNGKYAKAADFELQMDFSSNAAVYEADILVTDWSGIAYEYSLTTLKPVLFIDTPMKVMNPDYGEIGVQPLDIEIRGRIGIPIALHEVKEKIAASVDRLLHDDLFAPEQIKALRSRYLFNIGSSAKAGADYMINSLIAKSNRGKEDSC